MSREQLHTLIQQSKTINEIAAINSISKQRVHRLLKKYDLLEDYNAQQTIKKNQAKQRVCKNPECSNVFIKRQKNKYCSIECANKGHSLQYEEARKLDERFKPRRCLNPSCSKLFTPNPRTMGHPGSKHKYCSPECYQQHVLHARKKYFDKQINCANCKNPFIQTARQQHSRNMLLKKYPNAKGPFCSRICASEARRKTC